MEGDPTLLGPLGRVNLRIQWLRLARPKGSNRVSVSFPSHEDGNRSSFRNVVFPTYFELRTMDKVQILNDSGRYDRQNPFKDNLKLYKKICHNPALVSVFDKLYFIQILNFRILYYFVNSVPALHIIIWNKFQNYILCELNARNMYYIWYHWYYYMKYILMLYTIIRTQFPHYTLSYKLSSRFIYYCINSTLMLYFITRIWTQLLRYILL
jgi:hypothetical protein